MKTILNTTPRRWLAIAVIAALAATASISAVAGGKRHSAEHRAEKMIERADDRFDLDLSDAQKSELKAIMTEGLEKRQALRAQKEDAMRDLWLQDTLSADDIKQAMQAQREKRVDGEMRAQHEALIAETFAKVHAVLTPAQREAAADEMHRMILFGNHGKGGKHGKHGKRDGKRGYWGHGDHHDCHHS